MSRIIAAAMMAGWCCVGAGAQSVSAQVYFPGDGGSPVAGSYYPAAYQTYFGYYYPAAYYYPSTYYSYSYGSAVAPISTSVYYSGSTVVPGSVPISSGTYGYPYSISPAYGVGTFYGYGVGGYALPGAWNHGGFSGYGLPTAYSYGFYGGAPYNNYW